MPRKQGVRTHSVKPGLRVFRKALEEGRLIVTGDVLTYEEEHVILVIGHTPRRFWIVDPIIGLPTLRDRDFVIQGADSAFRSGYEDSWQRVMDGTEEPARIGGFSITCGVIKQCAHTWGLDCRESPAFGAMVHLAS